MVLLSPLFLLRDALYGAFIEREGERAFPGPFLSLVYDYISLDYYYYYCCCYYDVSVVATFDEFS
jgi:hypothetical protein